MIKILMLKRKILLAAFFIVSAIFNIYGQVYSSNQLIPAESWVYDAVFMLTNETQRTSFAGNAPMTKGELLMTLSLIPYDKLSETGKNLYDEVEGYLNGKSFNIDMGKAFLAFNTELYPEVLFKTSNDIDWSFNTDYTGKKNSVKESYKILDKENYREDTNVKWSSFDVKKEGSETEINYDARSSIVSSGNGYAVSSSFINSDASTPVVTVPLYFGWSDYVFIQTDPCFAKSIWAMSEKDNFTNLVYDFNDMDFLWPRNAYGSAGYHGENWGVNLNFGRSGLQIGKTLTGSVIYNSTFETEGYFQLNLYAPRIRYNLDAVEVSTDKYLYVHSLEARPLFNWIKLGITEATLIQKDFELKFLNPIMIMHSYGSWADSDYFTEDEENIYGEAHVCQYIGMQVELTPFKNSRIYFNYAQNEIQPANELGSANGKSMPDSFGAQLGFELTVPDKHNGWWKGCLEGVYTTPFCYIKQGADWSLYSERYDMQSHGSSPICSWIGTPFGPDAIGFETSLSYTKMRKWNAELDYLFVAHGTNSFGLFDNVIEIDGKKYYAYYPSVLRKMGLISDEEAEDIARTYALTGIIQYTNQVSLKGSYSFNPHLTLNGQAVYSFIFNNKNESGEFAQGIELSCGLEYKIFE